MRKFKDNKIVYAKNLQAKQKNQRKSPNFAKLSAASLQFLEICWILKLSFGIISCYISAIIQKRSVLILYRRDGNGEGRGGDQPPYTYPRYLAYVLILSPSELLKGISVPSSNNNRGSPKVPDSRINDTFFVFDFNLVILK